MRDRKKERGRERVCVCGLKADETTELVKTGKPKKTTHPRDGFIKNEVEKREETITSTR